MHQKVPYVYKIVFRSWIRCFLTPWCGSGISFSVSRITDPYFWKLSNDFWVKNTRILCQLVNIFWNKFTPPPPPFTSPDGEKSGSEIQDKHPGSATLYKYPLKRIIVKTSLLAQRLLYEYRLCVSLGVEKCFMKTGSLCPWRRKVLYEYKLCVSLA